MVRPITIFLIADYSAWSKYEVDVLCGSGTRSRQRYCYHNSSLYLPVNKIHCAHLGEWNETDDYKTETPCEGKYKTYIRVIKRIV